MQTESVSQPGRANASGAAAFAKRASFHLCFWILTALATQGASPFAPSLTTLPPLQGGSVAVGDFDHDGLMDIALCGLNQPIPNQTQSAQCAVWRNTGAGFVKVFEAFPQVGDASLAWVDVNNDGWLDLVISGLTGEAALVGEVWTYDGASFSKYSTLEFNLRGGPFTAVGNVCSGDFNNDGLIDLLLVANYDAFQFSYLFQNTGTGFTHLESGIEVLYYGGATVADFDNDGRLDFAVNGVAKLDTADVPRTTVVFNRESGLSPINLAPSSWDGAMASIDYNGDGREDLLLAGSFSNPYLLAPGAALWLNTPDGFQQAPINLPSFSSGMLAVVDFDNDGRSDILVCGHPSAGSDGVRAEALRAGADGQYETVWSSSVGNGSVGIAWIDVDGDGRLDFIHTGNNFNKNGARPTTIWKNVESPVNTRPTAPAGLDVVEENGYLRLSWDSASDAETPSAGLSYNVRIGSEPGKGDIVSPMAGLDGVRRVLDVGNARFRHFFLIQKPASPTLYWSVQAIDGGLLGGPFAPEKAYGKNAAPRFVSFEIQENGTFAMRFESRPGEKYQIEATTHFEFDDSGTPTPWEIVGIPTETSPGVYAFAEKFQTDAPSRFFRVVKGQ